MKSQREIYQALLDGKTLLGPKNIKIHLGSSGFIEEENGDILTATFSFPEDWEIYDELADLKKAFEEGALIEFRTLNNKWEKTNNPVWGSNMKYRIKDGISIEFWNKWKTLINAFWEGKTIQYRYDNDWRDWTLETIPKDFDRMRIKPEPTLYYRWKRKQSTTVRLSDEWHEEGYMPTGNYNWIRIEPGKTFEEIEWK